MAAKNNDRLPPRLGSCVPGKTSLPILSLSINTYMYLYDPYPVNYSKLNLNQPRTCLLMTKQKRWSTSLSTSDESFLRSKIRILMNKISTALCFSFCIMCKHGRDMRGAEQGTMPRQMGKDTCMVGPAEESLACGNRSKLFYFFSRHGIFTRFFIYLLIFFKIGIYTLGETNITQRLTFTARK